MAKQNRHKATNTMLELWRPPSGAGDALGCLATTFTFQPGLFDEQCLARFLEIESEPNREDLAFLLERESHLGSVYAGVMVDHTQAGVEHSLRWDVLPIRIARAKQHAKLSLLAWQNHVRILVASANLTEQGYRLNREVCVALDHSPQEAEPELIGEAIDFLRRLLAFVPGAQPEAPEVRRAIDFLDQVQGHISSWTPAKRIKGQRQHLVFSLPGRAENAATNEPGFATQSSLSDALSHCARRSGAPDEVWVASPFFDIDSEKDATTETLCKAMARGFSRQVSFCVPSVGEVNPSALRLAAPASLYHTAAQYADVTTFDVLPCEDEDENLRPWHAKMLGLFREGSKGYTALMIGSSNFTRAGMGIGNHCNAEANLLTVAEHLPRARLPGQINQVWPEMDEVEDLEEVEWQGATPELVEEERAACLAVPAGFLSATYRAGDKRELVLRLDVDKLPSRWALLAAGSNPQEILNAEVWKLHGCPELVVVPWDALLPPDKILVQWADKDAASQEAFLPLNVADARMLPPPNELKEMTADEMLRILAASDPSAAFRAWAKKRQRDEIFDEDLDAATPPDLDPLRRYDLKSTFLRRVRSRARILAQLRSNLQRPVWSMQALQWRLEGFIGIRPLAERVLHEVLEGQESADEALLTLADLVILLSEVSYEPYDGSLSPKDFNEVYQTFLKKLVKDLNAKVHSHRHRVGRDVLNFWDRVVERCRN